MHHVLVYKFSDTEDAIRFRFLESIMFALIVYSMDASADSILGGNVPLF